MIDFMAPEVGLEPTTLRLTAECSAIELLRSVLERETKSRCALLVITKKRACGNGDQRSTVSRIKQHGDVIRSEGT